VAKKTDEQTYYIAITGKNMRILYLKKMNEAGDCTGTTNAG